MAEDAGLCPVKEMDECSCAYLWRFGTTCATFCRPRLSKGAIFFLYFFSLVFNKFFCYSCFCGLVVEKKGYKINGDSLYMQILEVLSDEFKEKVNIRTKATVYLYSV